MEKQLSERNIGVLNFIKSIFEVSLEKEDFDKIGFKVNDTVKDNSFHLQITDMGTSLIGIVYINTEFINKQLSDKSKDSILIFDKFLTKVDYEMCRFYACCKLGIDKVSKMKDYEVYGYHKENFGIPKFKPSKSSIDSILDLFELPLKAIKQ